MAQGPENPDFEFIPNGNDGYLFKLTEFGLARVRNGTPPNAGDLVNQWRSMDDNRFLAVDTPQELGQCKAEILSNQDNLNLFDTYERATNVLSAVPGEIRFGVCTDGIVGVQDPNTQIVFKSQVMYTELQAKQKTSEFQKGVLVGSGLLTLALIFRWAHLMIKRSNQGYRSSVSSTTSVKAENSSLVTYHSVKRRKEHYDQLVEALGAQRVRVSKSGGIEVLVPLTKLEKTEGEPDVELDWIPMGELSEDLNEHLRTYKPENPLSRYPLLRSQEQVATFIETFKRIHPGAPIYVDPNQIITFDPNTKERQIAAIIDYRLLRKNKAQRPTSPLSPNHSSPQ